MVFVRNLLFCLLIFVAGFFVGNLYVYQNGELESSSKKDKIQKEETLIQIVKTVDVNKTKQKEVLIKAETKKIEKKYSNYEMFEIYLNNTQYEDALSIYQSHAIYGNIEKYQNYLFTHVENLISRNDSNSLKLINMFLEIQNDNFYALYLKSQIYFKRNRFEDAILVLNELKVYDLERAFEKKVLNALNQYTSTYVKKLRREKKFNKLIPFLQNIIQEDPNEIKYIYILAKVNYDLKNYESSKELLEQIISDDVYANKANVILMEINKIMSQYQRFSYQIALEKKGSHFYLKALLNGQKEVRLLLDTGASMTLIDESIIKNIEHTILKNNIRLNTAGGLVTAKYIQLDSFAIEDTLINKMKIVSSSIKKSGFDGLLGMNYLKEFDFYIDQENSILYLDDK